MRFDLLGAVILVGAGIILAIFGATWDRAYNTTYDLSVEQAIRGEHRSWLAPGPKMARVTGFALRRQVQRIPIQTESADGNTQADRAFFPLRMLRDNKAILVSLPFEQFDTNITLYDTADARMTYAGVLEETPESKSAPPIQQRFDGVTFPTTYCLVVGQEREDRRSKWLAVCGVAMAASGLFLALLRRRRHAAAPAPSDRDGQDAAARPLIPEAAETLHPPEERAASEAGQAEDALAAGRPTAVSAADAMAAMVAVVSGQAPPEADHNLADDQGPEVDQSSDQEPEALEGPLEPEPDEETRTDEQSTDA